MRNNVSWLIAAVLWFVGPVLCTGQSCLSVTEALARLHTSTDNGDEIARQIRLNCPAAADSLSLLFHQRSVYAFSSEENNDLAINFALRALREQRQLYAGHPQEPLGKTLANLGLFYRLNGQYTLAQPYLKEADEVFRQLGLAERKNRNNHQLVKLWHATGDFGRSEELLRLMLAETRTDDYPNALIAEAETRRLMGEQANQTENYADGLTDFAAAADLFKQLGDISDLLMTYMGQGRALYYLGHYPSAQQVTEKALALAGDYELDYDKAVMYNLLGLISKEQGAVPKAKEMVRKGQEFATADGDPRLASLLFNTAAEIAASEGDHLGATELNRSAIKALVTDWQYSEETPLPAAAQMEQSEYRQDLFSRLASQAEFLRGANENDEALNAVRRADQLADLLRAEFSGQVTKLFWRKEALPVYELGMQLSQQTGDQEGVFYFLEKSRSVLLLEALLVADARDRIDPAMSDELARTERKLQRQLQKLRVNKGEKQDSTLREVNLLRDSLQQIKEAIATRYPAIRQLLIMPELVNIDQARRNLARGGWDRQLHFFVGGDQAYVFSLSGNEAQLYSLGPTASLLEEIYEVLAYFTDASRIDQAPASFLAASHHLFQTLLKPLGLKAGEQLLIIPDGILAYLPFSALVTEPNAQELATAPYLLRQNQVSYAQSATLLDRQMRDVTSPVSGVVAFSPFTKVLAGNAAAALPFSQLEVDGLSRHYATIPYNGAAADRSSILGTIGNQAIIHLSTHAYATRDSLDSPRILTASEPVYLPDIYGLSLPAELVVLSACQSNIGPLARGEGVLGLGRAFTAAGARGVVASLWALNDRATADIVAGFYDHLAAGSSKPRALHEAQLDYLNRTDLPAYLKSPYYWAGLTYYGNAASLPAGGFPWKWLLALGLPVLLLAGWWYRKRKGIEKL